MTRRSAVAAALAIVAITFGGGAAVAKSGPVAAPDGLPDFYKVPASLPDEPGALVKSQKIDTPDVRGTLYRVMYMSESQRGKLVPVTGLIAVPDGDAPRGGFPVLSWAHGTDGMADKCAPSIDPSGAAPATNTLLGKGWVITATDYQGEGTPGLHPYIAGGNAARNTIDIVRAARHLKAAHASKNYVVWGHSQGGHTAMFALHIGEKYAPQLNLKGVVAGAPPSQFNLIYNFLKTSAFKHYLLMAAGGLNAAYGDKAAPLGEVLTDEGIALLPELDKVCSGDLQKKFANVDFTSVTKADPFTQPHWRKILRAEDPQNFDEPVDVPLLIVHGGNDEQIPTVSTALLSEQLCETGQHLERWVYPGQSHSGVVTSSLPDMIAWIDARFAGHAPPAPSATVEVTTCATRQ